MNNQSLKFDTYPPLALMIPNFMQVSEKNNERSPRYLKTDEEQTDQRTNKGDYHGPHRVNLGSKISKKA